MDDYEEVLEGCVAQLPGILAKADYAREKQDLTLIFKYLTDCCMMSGPSARRSPVDSVLGASRQPRRRARSCAC